MKKPGGRQLKAILILSVVAPIGLLVTFKLTGILEEPQTPEIVIVYSVSWNMNRPPDFKRIDELVDNSYTDNVVLANLVIHVGNYYENDQTWGGFDAVMSMVLVNMSVSEGLVESLFVNFTGLGKDAALDITEDTDHIEVVNFEVAKIVDWNWSFGKNAYIKATSINQPKNAYLEFLFIWMFKDPNNTDHQLTITLEAILFNGTTYQKIKVPIQMEVFRS